MRHRYFSKLDIVVNLKIFNPKPMIAILFGMFSKKWRSIDEHK